MEYSPLDRENAQPAPRGAAPDPWIAWFNSAPVDVEPPARSHGVDGSLALLALGGVAFWGAVLWAGYALLT